MSDDSVTVVGMRTGVVMTQESVLNSVAFDLAGVDLRGRAIVSATLHLELVRPMSTVFVTDPSAQAEYRPGDLPPARARGSDLPERRGREGPLRRKRLVLLHEHRRVRRRRCSAATVIAWDRSPNPFAGSDQHRHACFQLAGRGLMAAGRSRTAARGADGRGPSGRYEVVRLPFDGVLHGVNDAGEFVGQWLTRKGVTHAVHVTQRGTTDLGTLGGPFSTARGINDSGEIVGGALIEGEEAFHAFLYADGVMHDLNDLIDADAGWELVNALGINNRGDIVALGCRSDVDCVVLLRRRR